MGKLMKNCYTFVVSRKSGAYIWGMEQMQNPDTLDELLSRLDSHATVRGLAENMCNPLYRTKIFAMGDQLMVSIDKMKTLEDRVLPEIQKALIDEFVAVLDSSDEARRDQVAGLMHALIPPATNRAIMAAVLEQTLELAQEEELAQEKGLGLGAKPKL